MPKRQVILPLTFVWLAACAAGDSEPAESESQRPSAPDPAPSVILETNKGRIVIELDREKAPLTVALFLRHVGAGFYDGLTFHRIRPGFMIQAGRLTADKQRRSSSASPLQNEADNGLLNLRGTIAMARTSQPHSAVSEFFINVVDNPELDFTDPSMSGWGYAVFGMVTEGLDVVDAIAAVPTERWNQHEALPLEPIVIERAHIAESDGS